MGKFIGHVDTRWRRNPGADRLMELLADFSYEDNNGQTWTAPKGAVVDGASIPTAFQWLIGDPLLGDYRNASVIHDVACKTQVKPYTLVHEVFCEMLHTLKLVAWKRSLMCFAVKNFGPRWILPDPE